MQCEAENGSVNQYLEKYRQFSELCSSLSRHLATKVYEAEKISEIQIEIDNLIELIGNSSSLLSGFLRLDNAFIRSFLLFRLFQTQSTTDSTSWTIHSKTSIWLQINIRRAKVRFYFSLAWIRSPSRLIDSKIWNFNYFIDWLVNTIAASIWHRVRLKLQGRDTIKQLTVEEQVTYPPASFTL